MSEDLGPVDRAIANAFQGGFPVVERPFEPAAATLRERGIDITGGELIERIRRMDKEGVLTRFGALIDAEAIGGMATLVAMHAPEERFDAVAETVNDFPEVAHNYRREHPHLNMWFVLSVADEARIPEVLGEIEDATGQETYNLPKLRKGILSPCDELKENHLDKHTIERLNFLYARDYELTKDLKIITRNFSRLGAHR